MSFERFPVNASLQNAVRRLGWTEPTPIQAEAIPLLLQGLDLVGQAQTGTGKTGAFGIPAVESCVGRGKRGLLQVLVLVPTRELAIQVADDLNELGRETGVNALAVYGGVGMGNQEAALRRDRFAIVVATPGRLLDHLGRRTIDLRDIETVVLDEADRMLDMGFIRDVEKILRETPDDRQTVLFSATMPREIEDLARRFLRSPERVSVSEDTLAAPLAAQHLVRLAEPQKLPMLLHLLESERPERIIVFRRTRGKVQQLLRKLKARNVEAVGLHGDLRQGQRERSLGAFREGGVKVLVATDVAARGLDIPDVTHVVNLDCPNVPEAYVHRIGRTARAGQSGRTFLFATPDNAADVRGIERLLGVRLPDFPIPADLPHEAPPAASNGEPRRGGPPQHRSPRGPRGGNGGRNGPRREASRGPRRDDRGAGVRRPDGRRFERRPGARRGSPDARDAGRFGGF